MVPHDQMFHLWLIDGCRFVLKTWFNSLAKTSSLDFLFPRLVPGRDYDTGLDGRRKLFFPKKYSLATN